MPEAQFASTWTWLRTSPTAFARMATEFYWDFQKATPANGQKLPALGGPLPPSVLFVPARRVAGYSVTFPPP